MHGLGKKKYLVLNFQRGFLYKLEINNAEGTLSRISLFLESRMTR